MSATASRHRPHGVAWLPVAVAVGFLFVFLVVPVVGVFSVALDKGMAPFWSAVTAADTRAAVLLTVLAVGVSVPLNTAFGFAAAWAITKFDFRGKALLSALIDLPIAVSPVVAGLVFVLLFGAQGLWGSWLIDHGIRIVYAPPAIVLATVFVTFPYVARELIPLMEALGRDEEIAAVSLGASGWQMLWRITLPNVRWGLLYGVIVCTARAIGEFGAVSVVSGHIRGETNTLPLHVEILYNEYDQVGAFAVASLVSVVGLVALAAKKLIEWRIRAQQEQK